MSRETKNISKFGIEQSSGEEQVDPNIATENISTKSSTTNNPTKRNNISMSIVDSKKARISHTTEHQATDNKRFYNDNPKKDSYVFQIPINKIENVREIIKNSLEIGTTATNQFTSMKEARAYFIRNLYIF